MKKIGILCVLLVACSLSVSAKKILVGSETEFESLIPSLVAGDVVVIANGTYKSWSILLPNSGTAKRPIVIQAQTAGKVVFSGEVKEAVFKLRGSYVTLNGLSFTGCKLQKGAGKSGSLVELAQTQHCKIVRCTFKSNASSVQFMPLIIISGAGSYNRVERCVFDGNIDNQDVQVKITKEDSPTYTLITDNVFSNKRRVSWKNGNGGECVQVGQDPILLGNVAAYTSVTRNTFSHCDGENEIISNKSSKNTYSHNIFRQNDGELVMRGGHDCVVSFNQFDGGTGGIRVNGTGHIITNNRINEIKTAIRIMYGMAKGKDEIGFYIAASHCSITKNTIRNATIGILVGDSKNTDWTGKFDTQRYPSSVMQNVAPFDNEIRANKIQNSAKGIVIVEQ